jgi:hypothetical protein
MTLPCKPFVEAGVARLSTELFGDRRELIISHADVLYRLRITQHNKLILNQSRGVQDDARNRKAAYFRNADATCRRGTRQQSGSSSRGSHRPDRY